MKGDTYSDVKIDIPQLILRAAQCVSSTTDWEADAYEGQSPVEEWALTALEYAVLLAQNIQVKGAAGAREIWTRNLSAILDKYEDCDDFERRMEMWRVDREEYM